LNPAHRPTRRRRAHGRLRHGDPPVPTAGAAAVDPSPRRPADRGARTHPGEREKPPQRILCTRPLSVSSASLPALWRTVRPAATGCSGRAQRLRFDCAAAVPGVALVRTRTHRRPRAESRSSTGRAPPPGFPLCVPIRQLPLTVRGWRRRLGRGAGCPASWHGGNAGNIPRPVQPVQAGSGRRCSF